VTKPATIHSLLKVEAGNFSFSGQRWNCFIERMRNPAFFLLLVFLACGCQKEKETPLLSKGGYELFHKGANLVLHQPGFLELRYSPIPGKSGKLIWISIIGEPQIAQDLAIFSATVDNNHQSRAYPVVLVSKAGGVPVDITECLTKKYATSQGLEYIDIQNTRRFDVMSSTPTQFVVSVLTLPKFTRKLVESPQMSVTLDEARGWIEKANKMGVRKSYDKLPYVDASEIVNK
jgi:hypothetical protein